MLVTFRFGAVLLKAYGFCCRHVLVFPLNPTSSSQTISRPMPSSSQVTSAHVCVSCSKRQADRNASQRASPLTKWILYETVIFIEPWPAPSAVSAAATVAAATAAAAAAVDVDAN